MEATSHVKLLDFLPKPSLMRLWTLTTKSDLYVGRDPFFLVSFSSPVNIPIVVNAAMLVDGKCLFPAPFDISNRCLTKPKKSLFWICPAFGCNCCLICVCSLMLCVDAILVKKVTMECLGAELLPEVGICGY